MRTLIVALFVLLSALPVSAQTAPVCPGGENGNTNRVELLASLPESLATAKTVTHEVEIGTTVHVVPVAPAGCSASLGASGATTACWLVLPSAQLFAGSTYPVRHRMKDAVFTSPWSEACAITVRNPLGKTTILQVREPGN